MSVEFQAMRLVLATQPLATDIYAIATTLQFASPGSESWVADDLLFSARSGLILSPHPPAPSPGGRGGEDLHPLSRGERGLGGEG